ncbi:MAG TPA: asparagine synthase-related protein [Vicinamibacterales bacterium]|nr:asparagine synthase-related protein [Vicinamibacterales bacterium]
MREGIDRLVNLNGVRTAGLVGRAGGPLAAKEIPPVVAAADLAFLAATDGHFAAVAHGVGLDGTAMPTVRLARTIGLPLRYFVAKLYHGPFLVVADRIDRLFAWCCRERIAWQFDPSYTRMVPAHYLVEIDQVGCPDPMPRYYRFFDPPVAVGSDDVNEAGAAYVGAAYVALRRWLAQVPDGEPVAVAFSGGIDSTAVLLLACRALEDLGRSRSAVRAFTLDLGGGADARQAHEVVKALGLDDQWERVEMPSDAYDPAAAIDVIEDYHPLDVECAAMSLCLLRGIRQRYPRLRYLLDGDGGDENLKSYPLEDSDLTLASLLRNPLLYQEGWGIDAVKHSLTYSGGLSRSYVRTYAPAEAYGFTAFSPFTVRSVIAQAVAIPFETILGGSEARLATLKGDIVRAGVRAVTGIDMPALPKRRFQDGARAHAGARLSKAWCRRVFERRWDDRMRAADEIQWRSGNEVTVLPESLARP